MEQHQFILKRFLFQLRILDYYSTSYSLASNVSIHQVNSTCHCKKDIELAVMFEPSTVQGGFISSLLEVVSKNLATNVVISM